MNHNTSFSSASRNRDQAVNGSNVSMPSNGYSWNNQRLTAIGWDFAALGFAGAVLVSPAVPVLVTGGAVLVVVQATTKLFLDLALPDNDQSQVDKAWVVVDIAGRSAALGSAIVGSSEQDVLKHAKYASALTSVHGSVANVLKTRKFDSSDLLTIAQLYDAIPEGRLAEREPYEGSPYFDSTPPNANPATYDHLPVNVSYFSIKDLIGETNDPTINAESFDLPEEAWYSDDFEIDFDEEFDRWDRWDRWDKWER